MILSIGSPGGAEWIIIFMLVCAYIWWWWGGFKKFPFRRKSVEQRGFEVLSAKREEDQ